MAAIGLLELDIVIPSSRSLKDKRSVIRSLKDRILNQYNVSVAEVGHLDKRSRCHLAVVAIANARDEVAGRLQQIETLIDNNPEAQVVDKQLQWL